jgi:hypothetical protein
MLEELERIRQETEESPLYEGTVVKNASSESVGLMVRLHAFRGRQGRDAFGPLPWQPRYIVGDHIVHTVLPQKGDRCWVAFDEEGEGVVVLYDRTATGGNGNGNGNGGNGDLAAHIADTTDVHGIANTANLVVTTDPRLSDARTPTAHSHPISEVTNLQTSLDAKQDASTAATDAELSAHAADTTDIHGIADTSALATDADLEAQTHPLSDLEQSGASADYVPRWNGSLWVAGKIGDANVLAANLDGTAGTPSLRTLGTGAQQAAAGHDSRLADARTPTSHATTHQPGGSDALAVDAAAATGSLRTLGTGAAQATAGNDVRLSDARTPTAHKSTHVDGGSDEINSPLDPLAILNYTGRGVAVYHDANQSIANATLVTLAFNQERWDTHGHHDNTTNNSRLTAQRTGWYYVWVVIGWAANATGYRYGYIIRSATTYVIQGGQMAVSTAGTATTHSFGRAVYLAANDYVQVQVAQNSGAALNVYTTPEVTPEFGMFYIGE